MPPAIILPQNFKLDDDTQYDPIITHNKLGYVWSSYYGATMFAQPLYYKAESDAFCFYQQSIKLTVSEAIIGRIKNNKWDFFFGSNLGSDVSERNRNIRHFNF